MPFSNEQKPQLKELLLSLIPKDGSAKGNVTLRNEFTQKAAAQGITVVDADYWSIRDSLLWEDRKIELGKGKGGSVRLIPEISVEPTPAPPAPEEAYAKETALYEPFHETIRQFYVKDYRIKRFVSEITASHGRRATGGKWTRPDITLIAVRMHSFVPGKTIEVVTFEVKPEWAYGIEGVYETAAHSVFANKSYLAIHAPKDLPSNEQARLRPRMCSIWGWPTSLRGSNELGYVRGRGRSKISDS